MSCNRRTVGASRPSKKEDGPELNSETAMDLLESDDKGSSEDDGNRSDGTVPSPPTSPVKKKMKKVLTPSQRSQSRTKTESHGLNSSYPTSLFSEFKNFVQGLSICLKNSGYPNEVCQVVSKFIYFANQGRRVDDHTQIPWETLYDARILSGSAAGLPNHFCNCMDMELYLRK